MAIFQETARSVSRPHLSSSARESFVSIKAAASSCITCRLMVDGEAVSTSDVVDGATQHSTSGSLLVIRMAPFPRNSSNSLSTFRSSAPSKTISHLAFSGGLSAGLIIASSEATIGSISQAFATSRAMNGSLGGSKPFAKHSSDAMRPKSESGQLSAPVKYVEK